MDAFIGKRYLPADLEMNQDESSDSDSEKQVESLRDEELDEDGNVVVED